METTAGKYQRVHHGRTLSDAVLELLEPGQDPLTCGQIARRLSERDFKLLVRDIWPILKELHNAGKLYNYTDGTWLQIVKD